MNIPILETPKDIKELCQNYKDNFNVPQFKNFENFITGIIINDQADIDNLSKGFDLGKHYDSLHHFVSESHWDMKEVMKTSVSVIKHLPDKNKQFNEKGWLVIDDSMIEKFGKFMQAISKQYDHSGQRFLNYAHCLVALTYIDKNGNRYPINFDLYLTEEYCKSNQEKFRTKIEIAQNLIKYAIEQGIPFQGIIFDSWYFCKELIDFIEKNDKDWVTQSKSNRLVVNEGKTISLKNYTESITTQEKRNLLKTILNKDKDNEKVYRYQNLKKSFPSLKRGTKTIRLIVSYEYDKNKKLKKPIFLVSNRKDWRPEKLFKVYSMRWTIETYFKDAKQHLGLGDYQMRKLKGIKSHWCLVFTSAVVLELMRANCISEIGSTASHLSVGELCQKAFNQTFQKIIIHVIQQTKNSIPDHKILSSLVIE